MIKNNRIKGEIWVGVEGIPNALRAEDVKEENDGKVTFIQLVEKSPTSPRLRRTLL